MNNQSRYRGASFYVWHCGSQGKDDFCKMVSRCNGTKCPQYTRWHENNCAIDEKFQVKRKVKENGTD